MNIITIEECRNRKRFKESSELIARNLVKQDTGYRAVLFAALQSSLTDSDREKVQAQIPVELLTW